MRDCLCIVVPCGCLFIWDPALRLLALVIAGVPGLCTLSNQ